MLLPIVVNEDGSIEQIVTDDMVAFEGEATTTRASNVVPEPLFKQLVFIKLREWFGDQGRVADWTRRWKGPHIACMVDGPVLGPYPSRQAALDAEMRWLLKNRFGGESHE
jgi:hypothetical protein